VSEPLIEIRHCVSCGESWDLKNRGIRVCPACHSRNVQDGHRIPRKRKMEIVLRMVGEDPMEVVREVKPLWTKEHSGEASKIVDDQIDAGKDPNIAGIFLDAMSKELVKTAEGELPKMLDELLHRMDALR
jgi:hypothetical protein